MSLARLGSKAVAAAWRPRVARTGIVGQAAWQRTALAAGCSRPAALGWVRGLAEEAGKGAEKAAEKAAEGAAKTDEDEAAKAGEPKADAEAGEAAATGAEEELETLRAKVSELEEAARDSKDKMLRSFAEMENVRNRAKRDVENASQFANQKFAKALLEVADDLSRAIEAVPEEERSGDDCNPTLKSLYEGIVITESGLTKVLSTHGVTAFGETGDKFDPQMHEAMYQMESQELEPNTVAHVMSKGYLYNGRVLRPAQVGTVKP